MSENSVYTYVIHDSKSPRKDGTASTIDEEGGPAPEWKIEELVRRHYDNPYFEEQPDGRILIFRSKAEARDNANSVGEVKHAS